MGENLSIYSEVEVDAARDLVRELIRFIRSWRLYECDHPTLGELQIRLRQKWDNATAGGPLPLRLTDRKVFLEDEPLYRASGKQVLPTGLYEHGVVGFVLRRGLEPTETRRLVSVLAAEPDPSVDYATLLWEAELTHVQVLLDFDEEDEPEQTPKDFAEQVVKLGDPQDPGVGDDYDSEGRELAGAPSVKLPEQQDFDRFALTTAEQAQIEQLLLGDRYDATVRQAARMIHSMAREQLTPEEAATLEKGIVALTGAVTHSGDLDAAIEIVARACRMSYSEHDLELRVGERTLETFRDPQSLWTFFRCLDKKENLDRRALGEFLAQLGESVAESVGEWLLETHYPKTVADAMRVLGDAGTTVLVQLYGANGARGRERIGPALLEIGTPEALMALAVEFARLPQETRIKLLHLIGRNEDETLRRVVLDALDDPTQPVRNAAVGVVRKTDAPMLAELLEDFFERGVFESRYRKETEDFFEMLARVGAGSVADVLAERCMPKRFRLGLSRMTPLQQLCVRSLRRMRSPEARPVVEELRSRAPNAVLEILDSPLGQID